VGGGKSGAKKCTTNDQECHGAKRCFEHVEQKEVGWYEKAYRGPVEREWSKEQKKDVGGTNQFLKVWQQ